MLYIKRKPGQRIFVNESLVITVDSIRGGTVKLGFDGPRSMRVMREELARLRGECPTIGEEGK
jgi:carbon storage regulator CsrA